MKRASFALPLRGEPGYPPPTGLAPCPMDDAAAHFPYMFWARNEAQASAHCLSQSGMPIAREALAAAGELDLSCPPLVPLAALEGLLAQRLGIDPQRVIVTLGTTGAMHLLAWRFFPNSRVVTELPSYEPFRALPRVFGAQLRVVPRRHEQGWRLATDQLAKALHGARRGHLFLSTPHNPTGQRATSEELREQAALAADHDGVLISNEVYLEFADPLDRNPAATLAPNAISIGSLTKAYGLGPLRVGWIVLGEGLVGERDRLMDLAFLSYVDPPTPSLALALALWERLEELRGAYAGLHRDSRPILVDWLAACERLEGELFPVGLHAFPRVRGVDDTRGLQRRLSAEFGVDVVAGEFFGLPGHVRIGFGLPPDALRRALDRFGDGLAALT